MRKVRRISLMVIATMVWSLLAPGLLPWVRTAEAAPNPPESQELPQFRTQFSKRFQNPDGSLTEEVYMSSMHYFDPGTSTWEEVDPTLIRQSSGPYAYRTRANRFAGYLAPTSGGSDLLKVTYGDMEIHLTPLGISSSPAAVAGNRATFAQVLPATDLRYEFGADQIKEFIILRSASAVRDHWSFRLETVNLEPREESDNSIGLYGAAGERIFTLESPFAIDQGGATAQGSLRLRAQQGVTMVELNIDREWLRAPERHFPVEIDPTITLVPGPNEGQDVLISQKNPNDNYWSPPLDNITVGNDTWWQTNRGITRSLLSFTLPHLPSSALITEARLKLTEWSNNGPAADVDLYRVTSSWPPTSVTWATQPTTASTREDRTRITGAGDWYWNITTLVSDWYRGGQPNYGVMLRFDQESLEHRSFRSSRWTTAAERPKLTITYVVDPLGMERFWGFGGNMNIANGNMVLSMTDTAVPSRGLTAAITRTYNSRSTQNGLFGYGWTSELDMRLVIPANPVGSAPRGPVAFFEPDGTVHYFAEDSNGNYLTIKEPYLRLERTADNQTYKVTEKSGLVYTFGANGKLQSITDTNENTISYAYVAQAITITDPAERTLTVTPVNYVDPTGHCSQREADMEGFCTNPQTGEIVVGTPRNPQATQPLGDYQLKVYDSGNWTIVDSNGTPVPTVPGYGSWYWNGHTQSAFDEWFGIISVVGAGIIAGSPGGLPGMVIGGGVGVALTKSFPIPEAGTTKWNVMWVIDHRLADRPSGLADQEITYGYARFGVHQDGRVTVWKSGQRTTVVTGASLFGRHNIKR